MISMMISMMTRVPTMNRLAWAPPGGTARGRLAAAGGSASGGGLHARPPPPQRSRARCSGERTTGARECAAALASGEE